VEVTLAETRQVLHTTAEHRHHTTRHGVFEHIRRVLSVRSRDGLIDEMVFEWESDSLSPTGVSGLALGRALLASPRLASWARAPRRRAAEEEAEWIAEDEDFQRLDLKGCRQRHAEACPPIRAFVAKWPQGRRITDAKAALAKGEQ